MKNPLSFAVLFLVLFTSQALADDSAPAYVELTDVPTITVDWSKGHTQVVTLHGNHTFAFVNGQKGGKYLLIIKQDETGSRVPTWPKSVHWPGLSPPTLTTTANKKDYVSFFCDGQSYDLVGLSQGL